MGVRLTVKRRAEAGGAEKPQVVTLSEDTITLGRDDGCDVVLAQTAVSRNHARIEASPTGYYLTDTKSLNGTFVNDHLTRGAYLLQDGDYIRIGNAIYRFLAGGNIEAEYHEEIRRDREAALGGLRQVPQRTIA